MDDSPCHSALSAVLGACVMHDSVHHTAPFFIFYFKEALFEVYKTYNLFTAMMSYSAMSYVMLKGQFSNSHKSDRMFSSLVNL